MLKRALLISALFTFAALASGEQIPLRFSPSPPSMTPVYPVRTGVPLPPGTVTDPLTVRLLSNGREIDVQTEAMARYNDGSIKWLLLDFQIGHSFQFERDMIWPPRIALEYGKDVTRKPVTRAIACTEDAAGVTVDTGVLKAVIRKDGGGLLDEVWLDLNGDRKYADDEKLAAGAGSRANVMDFVHAPNIDSLEVMSGAADAGKLDRSKLEITELKVEAKGPLHAVVKVAGNYRYESVATTVGNPYADPQVADGMPKATKRMPFVMRLHFWRDSGFVEAQHTFIYEGDPDRDFPVDLSLAVPAPATPDAVVTFGKDQGSATLPRGTSQVIGLSQLSADVFEAWKSAKDAAPGIALEGKRAPGWFDVSNARWGVTATVWRSWQNYPKAFHAEFADSALRVFLWPREAGPMNLRRYAREWGVSETGARGGIDPWSLSRHASRGAARTHNVLFNFHAGKPPEAELAGATEWFRQKVYAWPSPKYLCETPPRIGASFSPPEPGKYDALEKIVDACFDWMLDSQDRFRWYGMLNYGDLQQCFQNVHATGRWESDYGRWGWFNGDASGYKPSHAMLVHFLRTGRRDIFDWMQAEVLHIVDVDSVNCEEYPWNAEAWKDMRGCGHRHSTQHWACFHVGSRGIQAGTFSQVYYLTGDERVRDVMDTCAQAAWEEAMENRGGRGGHSGGRDVSSRMLYAWEHTQNPKWRDVIEQKWSYVLNANRGAEAPPEADDGEWAREDADRALNVKKDYQYPGTALPQHASGVRYIKDPDARARYRKGVEDAVKHMQGVFLSHPQSLPPGQWPGPVAGPSQGNWNGIPNNMPLAIHALKLDDAAKEAGK